MEELEELEGAPPAIRFLGTKTGEREYRGICTVMPKSQLAELRAAYTKMKQIPDCKY